ncbi:MAG: hypothetical protein H6625_02635 [Bdellovibrionaceae bacterium]|nr:hypothetical protein [Pseudobdellovibrionaceae bacterium]
MFTTKNGFAIVTFFVISISSTFGHSCEFEYKDLVNRAKKIMFLKKNNDREIDASLYRNLGIAVLILKNQKAVIPKECDQSEGNKKEFEIETCDEEFLDFSKRFPELLTNKITRETINSYLDPLGEAFRRSDWGEVE